MHQRPPAHEQTRTWRASLHDAASPRRRELEAWVHSRYRHTHGADIEAFLPQFLVVDTMAGSPVACAGLRAASDAPLFLEQYLSVPVETLLAEKSGRAAVARNSIVEIGNLAARSLAVLGVLFSGTDSLLRAMEFDWAIFTATETVRRGLERAGFPLVDLGPAEGKLVGDTETWGSYYECAPRLTAIHHDDVVITRGSSPRLDQLCSDCWLLGKQELNVHAA